MPLARRHSASAAGPALYYACHNSVVALATKSRLTAAYLPRRISMKISLLIADDHAVVRHGIAAILKGSDIHVVAEAETGNQAIEQAIKLKPDVVLDRKSTRL